MAQTVKLVFSDHRYIILAAVIFVGLLVPLSIISEFIFLEPYVVEHLPSGREIAFVLIFMVASLSGLVVPMNIYRIAVLRNSKRKMSGGILGSFIGAAAGACSCGPIGFAIISTFGAAGGIATAFLTNYEIPLRIAAIAILVYVFYITTKSLAVECRIKE